MNGTKYTCTAWRRTVRTCGGSRPGRWCIILPNGRLTVSGLHTWVLDGNEIALYTIAVDGTEARRLAAIESWWHPGYEKPEPARAWIPKVSWSPDGSKILVLANQEADPGIQVIEADASGLRLVRVDNPKSKSVRDASWSPDGKRIAMVGEFGLGPSDDPAGWIALVTVAADGTDLRVLVGRTIDRGLVGLGVMPGDISAEVAACGGGMAVVDPEANPGLVEDCKTLLEMQNALAGPGGLNWLADGDIREWEGVLVDGTPPRVREVVLDSRSLGGEVARELSGLTELRVLDMPDNALMGEIPAELGELKNLEVLNLGGNYLSGEIPPELGGLAKLIHLWLGGNNLQGEIPPELGGLSQLTGLSLSGNNLRGDIPAELGELTNLTVLGLSRNKLTGCLPESLREIEANDFGGLGLPDCE